MGLKRGVAGVRRNDDDIGSRAIDRSFFDPGRDGFPSSDATFSLDVVGTIINDQQRNLDIRDNCLHGGFAGLDIAVAEKCLRGGGYYFAFTEWQ
jgi:hypothetical protein